MEPIKDIIQYELSEIKDNPIDQAGNRIKLRSVSHENLLKHLKNVPYRTVDGSQVEPEVSKALSTESEWSLISVQNADFVDGASKPINVKKNMLDNIRKHSKIVDINIEMHDDKTELSPNDVNVPVVANESVEENYQEVKNVTDNEDVSAQFNNTDSINTNDEIVDIREQLIRKSEILAQIEKEAEGFEKRAQEQAVQYTEVQKQIQDAEQKYNEILLKRKQFEKSQHETMINMNKNLDIRIEEVTKRRDESKILTEDYDAKINQGIEEFRIINDNIAREEEYIRALSFDTEVEIPYADNVEQVVKRVA